MSGDQLRWFPDMKWLNVPFNYTTGNAHSCLFSQVNHDVSARWFDYTAGIKGAMKMTKERDWVVISMQQNGYRLFLDQTH